MDETSYDIQELIDRSGVSRRNIYFYVQQGVLPAPQGAGLAARYGEEHLLRLRLIPLLRRDGLRLDQIREKFENTAPAALRRLWEEREPASLPAPAPALAAARSIGQAAAVYAPRPAVPCQRYDLPGGMTLIVPAQLSPEDRLRLERILKAAGISGLQSV